MAKKSKTTSETSAPTTQQEEPTTLDVGTDDVTSATSLPNDNTPKMADAIRKLLDDNGNDLERPDAWRMANEQWPNHGWQEQSFASAFSSERKKRSNGTSKPTTRTQTNARPTTSNGPTLAQTLSVAKWLNDNKRTSSDLLNILAELNDVTSEAGGLDNLNAILKGMKELGMK